MVSQILSAVLDNQPLIWWFPDWGESLWILSGSIVGGLMGWRMRSPQIFIIVVGTSIIILYGCSWLFFYRGGWIPLVASALAFVLTSSFVYLQINERE